MSGALKQAGQNLTFGSPQKHLGTEVNDLKSLNPKNKKKEGDKDKSDKKLSAKERERRKKKMKICFCGHPACGIGPFTKEVETDEDEEVDGAK